MDKHLMISASEIAEILGISMSHAYKIVRSLNDDLKQKGFLTIAGKTSRKFFTERFYGSEEGGEKNVSA